MNPHLTLAVNMGMVPGVTSTSLEHKPDDTVIVTVHGGNPMTVARMILSCLPPGSKTGGDTLVEVDGVVVRLNHVDPTPEQPEDFVAPLPLVTPEGRHEPMGQKPMPGGMTFNPNDAVEPRNPPKFQFSTVELVTLMGIVALLVIGVLVWLG